MTIIIPLLNGCYYKSCRDMKEAGFWKKLKDGESANCYYRKGDSIYCSANDSELGPAMKGVDINTFEVSIGRDGRSQYAKDRFHVYFPLHYATDKYTYADKYADKYVVESANPSTFKYIGSGYATDCSSLYNMSGKEDIWPDHFSELKEMINFN